MFGGNGVDILNKEITEVAASDGQSGCCWLRDKKINK